MKNYGNYDKNDEEDIKMNFRLLTLVANRCRSFSQSSFLIQNPSGSLSVDFELTIKLKIVNVIKLGLNMLVTI